MNRRGFFRFLGGSLAGIALEQAIPLGRVWSFPTNIVLPPNRLPLGTLYYNAATLDRLGENLQLRHEFHNLPAFNGGLINFATAL